MNPRLNVGDFYTQPDIIEPVDHILTDPPFGILQGLQAWDVCPDLQELDRIFARLLKPSGQALIFCDLNLLITLMASFNQLTFRHYHIWQKSGGMPVTKNRPIPDSDLILVFKHSTARERSLTWNPWDMGDNGDPYFKRNGEANIPTRRQKKSPYNVNLTGKRFPKTIIKAPSKPNMEAWERSNHPTQKAESLLRKLIRGYSNPGDLVLDPFAGSGSTLISAYKEGRDSIGFENDPQYYQEALNRIEKATNQIEIFNQR